MRRGHVIFYIFYRITFEDNFNGDMEMYVYCHCLN